MQGVTKDSPVPLYHQLKEALRQQIEAGRWKPGEQLPTEDELLTRFAVSKITVRQALRELASLGYVRREQGRGTFVQKRRLEQGPRELTSFTLEMQRRRLVPSSQVLDQGIVAVPPEIAAILKVSIGDDVFRLHRLRLADGEPMGLQTAYLPLSLVPGIDQVRFDGKSSLYDVLHSRYGLYPERATETHMAVLVGSMETDWLGVPIGSPAMAAERVACLPDGRPLEFVQSIMRGDRYRIALDLVRRPMTR